MNNQENLEICEELETKYTKICGAAMTNVYSMTKLSCVKVATGQSATIPLCNFNPNNAEHLFVLSVACALGGALGLQVAVDLNPIRLWKINRKRVKGSRLLRTKKEDKERALDPDHLLSFMRPWAAEFCGIPEEQFDFGKIYQAFYA